MARSGGEHDDAPRARACSEVRLLPAWPPGAMRRFDLAIATSFQLPAGRSRHSMMRSACGITKWCVNAATLRSTLPGHSEVVILTNDGKFAMEECGTARARVIAFDASLADAAAISASLFIIVATSVVLGTLLPLVLQSAKIDAAHASTTIQVVMDVLGVVITCRIATAVFEAMPA